MGPIRNLLQPPQRLIAGLNMNPFVTVLIGAVPLVLGLRSTARWLLFRGRKQERLEDLFRLFSFKHPIDQITFANVISLVGECYHVKPGKIRPDDAFDGRLGKLDSWNLGGGAEDLQRRLKNELSIQLRPDVRIRTVQELLDYCGTVSP